MLLKGRLGFPRILAVDCFFPIHELGLLAYINVIHKKWDFIRVEDIEIRMETLLLWKAQFDSDENFHNICCITSNRTKQQRKTALLIHEHL